MPVTANVPDPDATGVEAIGKMPIPADWGKTIIWGNHLLSGGVINPYGNAWTPGVEWGWTTTQMASGDDIVWGNRCAGSCDAMVFGTAGNSNIVWGTAAAGNVVWGTAARRQHRLGHRGTAPTTSCGAPRPARNIVWGTAASNNIVWGTVDAAGNIVWGTAAAANIVWGTDCGGADCNQVWGTTGPTTSSGAPRLNRDNIVWGTDGSDNIVWGTAAAANVVWGTVDGDNIVWGTAAREHRLGHERGRGTAATSSGARRGARREHRCGHIYVLGVK